MPDKVAVSSAGFRPRAQLTVQPHQPIGIVRL